MRKRSTSGDRPTQRSIQWSEPSSLAAVRRRPAAGPPWNTRNEGNLNRREIRPPRPMWMDADGSSRSSGNRRRRPTDAGSHPHTSQLGRRPRSGCTRESSGLSHTASLLLSLLSYRALSPYFRSHAMLSTAIKCPLTTAHLAHHERSPSRKCHIATPSAWATKWLGGSHFDRIDWRQRTTPHMSGTIQTACAIKCEIVPGMPQENTWSGSHKRFGRRI